MAELDMLMYEVQVIGIQHLIYFRHTLELEYKFDRTYGLPAYIETTDTSSLAIF